MLFFSKKHAQKTLLKNKKKRRFTKKKSKIIQNQEQANERASQVNQASYATQESQAKIVSQPKTRNRCFFKQASKAQQSKQKQTKQPNRTKVNKQANQGRAQA